MTTYNSLLNEWSDPGVEYPSDYKYKREEQPVDDFDNYFNYNVTVDLDHLISLTNKRLDSSADTGYPGNPEPGNLVWRSDKQSLEVFDDTNTSWKRLLSNDEFDTHTGATSAHGANGDIAGMNDVAQKADDPHGNGSHTENYITANALPTVTKESSSLVGEYDHTEQVSKSATHTTTFTNETTSVSFDVLPYAVAGLEYEFGFSACDSASDEMTLHSVEIVFNDRSNIVLDPEVVLACSTGSVTDTVQFDPATAGDIDAITVYYSSQFAGASIDVFLNATPLQLFDVGHTHDI